MTPEQFQTQIGRLISTFGKNAYPDERVKIIHNEFGYTAEPQLRRMVDLFIGEFRVAPLIKDFREMAARMRESAHDREREQLRKDSSDFWNCKYTPDDKKWIVQIIKQRLEGKISDKDYAEFIQVLKNAEREAARPQARSFVSAAEPRDREAS